MPKTPLDRPFLVVPPITRRECVKATRPCPWVRCVYHMLWICSRNDTQLIFQRNSNEGIATHITSFMKDTCLLDIADAGPLSQDKVAAIMGISRRRVVQLERLVSGGRKRKRRLKRVAEEYDQLSDILEALSYQERQVVTNVEEVTE